ncbi:ferric-chelate reductase, partial [Colletotrichum asianum]
VPGLAIWLVDRGARLMRSFLIHYQYLPDGTMDFQTAPAKMTLMPDAQYGHIVRLDFSQPHDVWKPGQHFYICFAKSSVWQSHPFTPLNLPIERNGAVEHAYIFRAKKGETRKVAQSAAAGTTTTPVILQGPYGEDHTLHLTPDANVLCIAGGTGMTYVLPTLHWLVRQPANPNRQIALVWAVRLRQDLEWVRAELDALAGAKGHGVSITIHITREESENLTSEATEKSAIDRAQSSSSRSSSSRANGLAKALEIRASGSHPRMADVVPAFLSENIQGRTAVFASGPGAMISDLRGVVAAANSGGQVWKGNEMADVELICDNRLECSFLVASALAKTGTRARRVIFASSPRTKIAPQSALHLSHQCFADYHPASYFISGWHSFGDKFDEVLLRVILCIANSHNLSHLIRDLELDVPKRGTVNLLSLKTRVVPCFRVQLPLECRMRDTEWRVHHIARFIVGKFTEASSTEDQSYFYGSLILFPSAPSEYLSSIHHNCETQKRGDQLAKAQVPVTLQLLQRAVDQDAKWRGIQHLAEDHFVEHLKDNLHWRMVSMPGEVIPTEKFPNLKVFILKGNADHHQDPGRPSVYYSDYEEKWEITQHKVGGARPQGLVDEVLLDELVS